MSPDRFQRVMELFQRACELRPGERTFFLNDACPSDPDILSEVRAMLAHDQAPTGVMNREVVGGGMRMLAAEIAKRETIVPGSSTPVEVSAKTPRQIGRYRVIRKLGEGGMGVVYLAEQERPRRIVAIKVIRPGLASQSMLRRFEYEAHILGRLHHPGIAQIFEAGTAPVISDELSPGLPPPHQAFLAMEYIEGRPITLFAEQADLPPRERLALFARVCHAVQHAHQKGVIHRDLKPGNILVSDEVNRRTDVATEKINAASAPGVDEPVASAEPPAAEPSKATRAFAAKGHARSEVESASSRTNIRIPNRSAAVVQPKILDFGVARVTSDDLHLTTVHTSLGQLIGTLPYMSPEQVSGEAEEVDTRSDVYALGVILYQLLAGRLPHEFGSRSIPEAARIIRDEPPARLSSISRVFRGEIETIVSKALEKDKSRRYQSAADLAGDIERYLAGEPIDAKRDSALYVLRKQLKRYRGVFAAITVFVVALIAFSVVSAFQSEQNRRLAQSEEAAKRRALTALEETGRLRDQAEDQTRIAQAAQRIATETSERLAVELDSSRVERGRMLGLAGNIFSADELIWPVFLRNPDSAQAYWALWQVASRANCLATVVPHSDSVLVCALGPEDRLLFTCSQDGFARAFRFPSFEFVADLVPDRENVQLLSMAISGDRGRIAISSSDQHVRVFDTRTLALLCELDGAGTARRALTLNADGSLVAFSGIQNVLDVYSVPDGQCRATIVVPGWGPNSAAFSPDSARIAIGEDYYAGIWSLDGDLLLRLKGHAGAVGPVAFSPDGATLYSGSYDRDIRVWDLQRGECVRVLAAPNGTVRTLLPLQDGESLLSGGWYWIYTWDTTSGQMRRRTAAVTSSTYGTVTQDESLYAAGGELDGAVRIYDLDGTAGRDLPSQTGRMSAVFSRDGHVLATGDGVGSVCLWDARTLRKLGCLPHLGGRVRTIVFHPNRPMLATGCADGIARFWDLRSGELLRSQAGVNDLSSACLDFDPSGQHFAIAGTDSRFRVFELDSGREVAVLKPLKPSEAIAVAFSPDGARLATSSRSNQLFIWDLWQPEAPSVDLSQPLNQTWIPNWSPDGRNLLCGSWTREIHVYDAHTGQHLRQLEGHGAFISQTALRPTDSSIIASAGGEGAVRLYDWRAGRLLAVLDEFGGWDAITVSFSADGRFLACGNAVGGVRIWDLEYYRRHIAGNLEYQLSRHSHDPASGPDRARLKRWSDAVWTADNAFLAAAGVGGTVSAAEALSDPPYAGVTAEMIECWGQDPQ